MIVSLASRLLFRYQNLANWLIACWFDHSRDLLFLVNQFQDEMPHPIIGIGHSMGGTHM